MSQHADQQANESKTAHHGEGHHVIVPVKTYVLTLISLLVLTVVTVGIAQFDFGNLNFAVAMSVALLKASLVAMIFMGLKWDQGFNRFILFSSLFFMGLFVLLVMVDVQTRGDRDSLEMKSFGIDSPVRLIQPGESGHGVNHGDPAYFSGRKNTSAQDKGARGTASPLH